MSSELIRTWVAGWADSRHAPRPIELPWGLYAEAGLPKPHEWSVFIGGLLPSASGARVNGFGSLRHETHPTGPQSGPARSSGTRAPLLPARSAAEGSWLLPRYGEGP